MGQTGEDLVPVKAMIVADRQGSRVDVIEPSPGPLVAGEEEHQRHDDTLLQGDQVRALQAGSDVFGRSSLGSMLF